MKDKKIISLIKEHKMEVSAIKGEPFVTILVNPICLGGGHNVPSPQKLPSKHRKTKKKFLKKVQIK